MPRSPWSSRLSATWSSCRATSASDGIACRSCTRDGPPRSLPGRAGADRRGVAEGRAAAAGIRRRAPRLGDRAGQRRRGIGGLPRPGGRTEGVSLLEVGRAGGALTGTSRTPATGSVIPCRARMPIRRRGTNLPSPSGEGPGVRAASSDVLHRKRPHPTLSRRERGTTVPQTWRPGMLRNRAAAGENVEFFRGDVPRPGGETVVAAMTPTSIVAYLTLFAGVAFSVWPGLAAAGEAAAGAGPQRGQAGSLRVRRAGGGLDRGSVRPAFLRGGLGIPHFRGRGGVVLPAGDDLRQGRPIDRPEGFLRQGRRSVRRTWHYPGPVRLSADVSQPGKGLRPRGGGWPWPPWPTSGCSSPSSCWASPTCGGRAI